MEATVGRIVSTQAAKISDYVVAIMATVVAHGFLFLLLVGLAVLEVISRPDRVIGRVPPPDVLVEIRPEMFLRASAPPAPRQDSPKRMVRTAAHQESEVAPDETNLIGERDTLAASELPPDPDGARVPSQEGRKPRRPEEVQTFDSQYQEGLEPDVAVTPMVDEQAPPGDPALKPADEVRDPAAGRDTAPPPPPGGEPREELYATETQVPVAPREDETERETDQESLPKESERVSEAEEAKPAGGGPEAVPAKPREPSDPGFRTEVRKTRLRGAIRRQGASSQDVENTAMGRYQAALSRAVEREWQRNCFRYREHITPGMLTIRFLLDEKGRVTGIRFLEVMEATTIQKGFTMKSIQSADIPAMPKEIVRELDGDPLELIYNFFF